jgi:hypothetical protein
MRLMRPVPLVFTFLVVLWLLSQLLFIGSRTSQRNAPSYEEWILGTRSNYWHFGAVFTYFCTLAMHV